MNTKKGDGYCMAPIWFPLISHANFFHVFRVFGQYVWIHLFLSGLFLDMLLLEVSSATGPLNALQYNTKILAEYIWIHLIWFAKHYLVIPVISLQLFWIFCMTLSLSLPSQISELWSRWGWNWWWTLEWSLGAGRPLWSFGHLVVGCWIFCLLGCRVFWAVVGTSGRSVN